MLITIWSTKVMINGNVSRSKIRVEQFYEWCKWKNRNRLIGTNTICRWVTNNIDQFEIFVLLLLFLYEGKMHLTNKKSIQFMHFFFICILFCTHAIVARWRLRWIWFIHRNKIWKKERKKSIVRIFRFCLQAETILFCSVLFCSFLCTNVLRNY